jgi:hypothetical protein
MLCAACLVPGGHGSWPWLIPRQVEALPAKAATRFASLTERLVSKVVRDMCDPVFRTLGTSEAIELLRRLGREETALKVRSRDDVVAGWGGAVDVAHCCSRSSRTTLSACASA